MPADKNNVRDLHKRLLRYESPRRFGVGMKQPGTDKERPAHVNTRHNPRPLRGVGGRNAYRVESKLTPHLTRQHTAGCRSTFHLSDADKREGLLALDIDGEAGVDWTVAASFASAGLAAKFQKLAPFVEPGRSWPRKGGAYAWFRILWGDTPAPVRAAIELELNRELKRTFPTPPPGVTFDALKGRTSFEYDNPNFDASFARDRDEHSGHYELEVEPGLWLTSFEARKHWRKAGIPLAEQVPRNKEWIIESNEEAYEKAKVFYGCRGRDFDALDRFSYEPRLERTSRFFGVLVTRPCYAALRGDRPNNINDFLVWSDNPAGQLTVNKVLSVLPREAIARIERVREAVVAGTWPRLPKAAGVAMQRTTQTTTTAPEATLVATPPPRSPDTHERGRIDREILFDSSIEQHLRYCAAARIALRETKGDQALALTLGLRLVEQPGGPATGERHAERESHMERCIAFAANDFKAEARGAGAKPFFTLDDVDDMQRRLSGRISGEMIAAAKARHPAARGLDRRTIAAVACWFTKNIATGNIGEVPVESISKGLAQMRMGRNTSTIAAATNLLLQIQHIKMIRDYSGPVMGNRGRCRGYVLGAKAVIQSWAAEFITTAMREAVPAGADRPSSRPLSPLDNEVLDDCSVPNVCNEYEWDDCPGSIVTIFAGWGAQGAQLAA